MDRNDPEFLALQSRIQAYDFHKPDEPRSFAARVRQECGWSLKKAERAIAEYRRFLILAGACGHPVSPSPLVDQVWHLHLTDTRRYWGEFCPEVLGRPFHHEPSRGGCDEHLRLKLQYQMTLSAYARLFGEAPPADFWPEDPETGPVRRLLQRLVAGKRLFHGPTPLLATPLLLAAAGCAAIVDSSAPGAIQGPQFLALYGLVALVALWTLSLLQGFALRPKGGKVTARDLDPYELAYLAGGPSRVVQTALTRLYLSGHVGLAPAGRTPVEAAPLPANASPVEVEVMSALRSGSLARRGALPGAFRGLLAKLVERGLLPGPKASRTAWTLFPLVIGALIAFGLVRLSFGMENRRPVAFLVMMMIVSAFLGLIVTGIGVGGRGRVRALLERVKPEVPRTAESDDAHVLMSVAQKNNNTLAALELLD